MMSSRSSGQSLVEVLLAVAVAAVLLAVGAALFTPTVKESNQTIQAQNIAALESGLVQNLQAWANGNWNTLTTLATTSANEYCLNTAASLFSATNDQGAVTIGSSTYIRYFYVDNVYRDASGNVTTTASGNYSDPSTKKITVVVGAVTSTVAPTGTFPSWIQTTPLPSPLYVLHLATVAYNGYLYTIGGIDSANNGTTSVYFARIGQCGTLGNWTATTPLPYVSDYDPATVGNGYIYALTLASSTVQYAKINADGSLGSWTATSKLPVAVDNAPFVAWNGYLYMAGGLLVSNGTQTSTVNYAKMNADGSLGSWTATTRLPNKNYEQADLAYNGYLYTLGGGASSQTSTVQYAPINASGTIGAWVTTNPLPWTQDGVPGATASGYMYEWGGAGPAATVGSAQINADGTVGSWTSTSSLPSIIGLEGGASYNNYMYSVGGSTTGDQTGATSTVLFAPPVNLVPTMTQTISFLVTRNTSNAYVQNNWVGGPAGNVSASVSSTFTDADGSGQSEVPGIATLVPATSTIAHVKSGGNSSSGNSVAASFTPTNAGDMLIVECETELTNATTAISDTKSNTWTLIDGPVSSTGPSAGETSSYYTTNIPSGADTITCSFGGSNPYFTIIDIDEFSGTAASPIDQHSLTRQTSGSGGFYASTVVTPTAGNEYAWGYGWVYDTATKGSGWTLGANESGDITEYEALSTGTISNAVTTHTTSTFAAVSTSSNAVATGVRYVQSTVGYTATASTVTSTFALSPTVGDLVIAAVSTFATNVTSLSDSAGNTYTFVASSSVAGTGGNIGLYVYYAQNIVTTSSFKLTGNLSGGTEASLIAEEVAGAATSSALDQTHTKTGSGTQANSGNVTTTAANEILFAAETDGETAPNPVLVTSTTGWVGRQYQADNNTYQDLLVSDRGASATTTDAARYYLPGGSGGYNWESIIATFLGTATSSSAAQNDILYSSPNLIQLNL